MYETVIYKIYMYLETIDELIYMEDCETWKEAIGHCKLYFDKNPHDYLICRYKPHKNEGHWLVALNYL